MILVFELTMPSRASWDGRWSGQDRRWIVCRKFSTKQGEEKAAQIAATGNFHYHWSDGWAANINVKIVDADEKRRLEKLSAGFNGYDWMVGSIIDHGKILADHQLPKAAVV